MVRSNGLAARAAQMKLVDNSRPPYCLRMSVAAGEAPGSCAWGSRMKEIAAADSTKM